MDMNAEPLAPGPDGVGGMDPLDPAQVATARAFLKTLTPTRSASARSPSSYALKHICERWGRVNGMSPYVTNAALLAAAAELGYPIWLRPGRWRVAHVGVCTGDLRRLHTPPPGTRRTSCRWPTRSPVVALGTSPVAGVAVKKTSMCSMTGPRISACKVPLSPQGILG